MTPNPNFVSFSLSNAARMVMNAVATETGPLNSCELFIAGYDLVELLKAIPNTLQVGDKEIDLPRALGGIRDLQPNDPQRIGIEHLASQWHAITVEVTLPQSLFSILLMQVEYILANQPDRTHVVLQLTRANWELINILQLVRHAR